MTAAYGEYEQNGQRPVSPSVQHQKDLDKLPRGLRGIWKKHRERRTSSLKGERNGTINAARQRGRGQGGRR